MKIDTTRFGYVEIEADDLLQFPAGLFGLEDCRHWVLLADAEHTRLGLAAKYAATGNCVCRGLPPALCARLSGSSFARRANAAKPQRGARGPGPEHFGQRTNAD